MNQLENLTSYCDGYTQVDEENLESYKSVYFYIQKENNETLFPFIYKKLNSGVLPSKCILMIKKNELIDSSGLEKKTYSL